MKIRIDVSTTVLIRCGLEEKLSVYSVLRGQNEHGFVQPFFWRELVKMIDVLGTFWCWSTIVYDSSKLEVLAVWDHAAVQMGNNFAYPIPHEIIHEPYK